MASEVEWAWVCRVQKNSKKCALGGAECEFLVCYLGMKWWMGQHSTIPMAPGLTQSRLSLALVATKGLFSAFLPGLGPHAASWLARGWNGDHYLRFLAAELLALTVSLVLLKPVYR